MIKSAPRIPSWLPSSVDANSRPNSSAARLKGAAERVSSSLIQAYVDFPARAPRLLQALGGARLAVKYLRLLYNANPHDAAIGRLLADSWYRCEESRYEIGTPERGRWLMEIMQWSFPSDLVSAAYFANLDALMARRAPRAAPGKVVIGLGTGRSGSTTISGIFAQIEDGISTHENAPLLYWEPLPCQVQFHLRRFATLARYYSTVFECSHWWLNSVDHVLEAFPSAKVIGLWRDTEVTALSLMKVTERWINHWAAPHNGIWLQDNWSPTYPAYPVPKDARADRDAAKLASIRAYVQEYNARMKALAAALPERVLLLRTDELEFARDPREDRGIRRGAGVRLAGAPQHRSRR